MIEEKGAQLFQTKRGAQLGVIAQTGVSIQRQMRAINREIVLDQAADQFVAFPSPRVGRSPKKPVMH